MSTIVQVSDPHLDLSPERLHRFEAVLRQVSLLPQVDALLLSGDLADHATPDEYAQVFTALPSGIPTLVCAGNHNLAAPLAEARAEHGLPGDVLRVDDLTVIALDSHIDGRDDGLLAPETLAFARAEIAAASGPVAVMMHHPPVPIGHHIVDAQYALANPDDLAVIVRASSDVIAVLTGHVHAAFTTSFAGIPVLGAPGVVSTMRLGSRDDPIADPNALPGFAVHTVEGASIRTVFHTLSPQNL